MGFIVSMFCNFVLNNILAIFVLTTVQLHPFLIGIYKFGVMAASSYFSMTVIELATLRFLIVFVWKRVPPIQDQFTVMFLTALNILISCLVSGSRFQTMEDLGYDAQFLGADAQLVPPPALRMKYVTVYLYFAFKTFR